MTEDTPAPEIYLGIRDQRKGPFTREQVQEMLRVGEVNLDTLSWKKGMADWIPLKKLLAPQKLQNIKSTVLALKSRFLTFAPQKKRSPVIASLLELIFGFCGFLGIGRYYSGDQSGALISLLAFWTILAIYVCFLIATYTVLFVIMLLVGLFTFGLGLFLLAPVLQLFLFATLIPIGVVPIISSIVVYRRVKIYNETLGYS